MARQQRIWVFQPKRFDRYEGDGAELEGVAAWLWSAFVLPVRSRTVLQADWRCLCCEGELLATRAEWRPTREDNPRGGVFIVEVYCEVCGDGGRHWMGASARWVFSKHGRCWVDQHGTSCGTRHVHAYGRWGLREGEHAALGRRRPCRHPRRREYEHVRGSDNGPTF